MKLLRHRADIKWLETWIEGSKCDCDTCNMFRAVKKRYRNLILACENGVDATILRYGKTECEKNWSKGVSRVLKDAEVNK